MFIREGAVSSGGQRVLPLADTMMRTLMGRVGLDPPSRSGLAGRWGTGHSTDTEYVARADSRVTHTMTFSGTDDPGWCNRSEVRQGAAYSWALVVARKRRVGRYWFPDPPQMSWTSFDKLRFCTFSWESLCVVLLNLFQGVRGMDAGGEGKRVK